MTAEYSQQVDECMGEIFQRSRLRRSAMSQRNPSDWMIETVCRKHGLSDRYIRKLGGWTKRT